MPYDILRNVSQALARKKRLPLQTQNYDFSLAASGYSNRTPRRGSDMFDENKGPDDKPDYPSNQNPPDTGPHYPGGTGNIPQYPDPYEGMPKHDTPLPRPKTPPQQPADDTPDWLSKLLSAIYGDESAQDWSDIEKMLQNQQDRASRQYAEAMGSRGMADSGAMYGGVADIAAQAAANRAKAYIDWKDKRIARMMELGQMLFQDMWRKLDYEHQKAMAKLMFELDRKAKLGENYNPNLGDYEIQILLSILNKPDIDKSESDLIKRILKELGYDLDNMSNSGSEFDQEKADEIRKRMSIIGLF